jgi:thiamine-phosphate pyrophosphorylase
LKKPDFRLILVTDRKQVAEGSLAGFINRCCVYGIKAVQLREKDLQDNELLSLAKHLRRVTRKNSAKLIVNDRLDIALLTGADGVHSPEQGISAGVISRFSKNLFTGKSVHSPASAKEAESLGFDYIICGPVFETQSKKKFGKPLGLDILAKVCKTVKIPVYFIGGITPYNVKKCLLAGAYGAGVIGSIFNTEDLKETIDDFKNAMETL